MAYYPIFFIWRIAGFSTFSSRPLFYRPIEFLRSFHLQKLNIYYIHAALFKCVRIVSGVNNSLINFSKTYKPYGTGYN